jgi:lipopolysaccharide/colanic/teichoic acid biosynthesis glycosyltransferase
MLNSFFKRVFDLVASSIALLLLWPLFVVIALWIKLDSKGPVFFQQTRVGRYEKNFKILKFRSMSVPTSAHAAGLLITVGQDTRVTKSGVFIRKTKLDELPQLINVLKGEMSIVGPRPEVPKYIACYTAEQKSSVLSVRPGITDNASIEFRDENEILGKAQDPEKAYKEEVLPIKIRHYINYVEKNSLLEDFKIVFKTIKVLF